MQILPRSAECHSTHTSEKWNILAPFANRSMKFTEQQRKRKAWEWDVSMNHWTNNPKTWRLRPQTLPAQRLKNLSCSAVLSYKLQSENTSNISFPRFVREWKMQECSSKCTVSDKQVEKRLFSVEAMFSQHTGRTETHYCGLACCEDNEPAVPLRLHHQLKKRGTEAENWLADFQVVS